MISKSYVFGAIFLVFLAIALDSSVEGRYLPTRANGDRIEKLRELLKEVSKVYSLLESELEKEEMGDVPRWHPESKLFYKREAIKSGKEKDQQ
ncbi:unnamed protein product [Phyllotreta striolata]|uniref:Uncharacterized protein n=1 Tax=Phyllotreta striolata TaxID=444603 RepID=A0A9N9TR91_PHYSR|nr:unnamed protein product [Phyllotreta striolata]